MRNWKHSIYTQICTRMQFWWCNNWKFPLACKLLAVLFINMVWMTVNNCNAQDRPLIHHRFTFITLIDHQQFLFYTKQLSGNLNTHLEHFFPHVPFFTYSGELILEIDNLLSVHVGHLLSLGQFVFKYLKHSNNYETKSEKIHVTRATSIPTKYEYHMNPDGWNQNEKQYLNQLGILPVDWAGRHPASTERLRVPSDFSLKRSSDGTCRAVGADCPSPASTASRDRDARIGGWGSHECCRRANLESCEVYVKNKKQQS